MRVVIFGASGMLGQGVLRECLRASDVEQVVTIVRVPSGASDPKLVELVHTDLLDYRAIESTLSGLDACYFCLGVSSAGLDEAQYTRITYDIALAAARTLARLNPQMTFIYVSGQGTDATEQGRIMWARVKGRTENALRALPFKAVYAFRPGFIQPLHGARSRTRAYRMTYLILAPVMPLLRALFPNQVLTTEVIAQAMLNITRHGARQAILGSRQINAAATSPGRTARLDAAS
jgi:uncharacterized protein YbjT (DUF2867 family)